MKMRVHTSSSKRAMQPVSGRNLMMAFAFVGLMGLLSVSFAQQQDPPVSEKLPLPSEVNIPAIASAAPFLAETTGNDVYIRSGPGTNYYHCGKLQKGDKVQVVRTQPGWSCIVPPPGCFSWIAMQYISINLDNPTLAIVTGNGVWVYAGSDYVEPMHSTSKQAMLNRGDKIRLLGEEKDDYCKIAPPDGAYVWVSTDYTESIGPAGQKSPTEAGPGGEGASTAAKASVQEEKLKEWYAVKEKIKAEQAKPIAQQNYEDIKKSLTVIAKDADAGKAARYAEAMIQQIAGFELAREVAKEIELQTTHLQQTTQRIDKAYTSRLSEIKDLGRFVVIGEFQSSSIYDSGAGAKRYRIIGKSGTTVCYAVPSGKAAAMDLSKLVGKKVGLVGTIKPHQPTAGAIVQFTDIVEMS